MTEYDHLNWLYEVLYAEYDENFLEEEFLKQNSFILEKSKRILDASCGNGILTQSLIKAGYDVSASDISVEMVELTKKRISKMGSSTHCFVSSWQELPEMNEKYDLIFCYGNSISHSKSKKERIQNIQSLYSCLNKNGILVLDTRNWDKQIQLKYTTYNSRKYNNKMYTPIYIWDFEKGRESSSVTIVFVESDGNTMKTYERKLTFSIFLHEEIIEEVKELGFEVIKDTFENELDEYCLYLKKSV